MAIAQKSMKIERLMDHRNNFWRFKTILKESDIHVYNRFIVGLFLSVFLILFFGFGKANDSGVHVENFGRNL
jgi:hypothetical protein